MNESEKKHISKMMSLILRHNPKYINVTLDKNGWLPVKELMKGINKKGFEINERILNEIVSTNDKQRFAFSENGEKIRANQGHSLKVDVELKEVTPPEYLYHGTVDKFMNAIRKDGLKKMKRQHVHLSKDRDTAISVGSRRGKPIILSVRSGAMSENGISFYQSENGVWLTDHIEPSYIEFGK